MSTLCGTLCTAVMQPEDAAALRAAARPRSLGRPPARPGSSQRSSRSETHHSAASPASAVADAPPPPPRFNLGRLGTTARGRRGGAGGQRGKPPPWPQGGPAHQRALSRELCSCRPRCPTRAGLRPSAGGASPPAPAARRPGSGKWPGRLSQGESAGRGVGGGAGDAHSGVTRPMAGAQGRGAGRPARVSRQNSELGRPALGALVVIAAEVISTRNLLNVVLCQALF